ncbi:hypothetical protein [Terasakiella sp. SH-1]|uniref:hypothetical protein n=1 Tax=Terasakiella sp. SH-1 TaxID=2560057 RepID=UPI0010739F9E|nr:hypothetical protein [Terasakiella sp. SH-1]
MSQFKYAVILQHTTSSPEARKAAEQLEKTALYEILFRCGGDYRLQALRAQRIAVTYSSNLFFPRDMKKAAHWRGVAQSFEERFLYRCPAPTLRKCWRP